MTRAHDRQKTLPQRRRTSCMNTPRASCSLLAPISRHCVRARASAASRARACTASLLPWQEPTTRPSTGSQVRSSAAPGQHATEEVVGWSRTCLLAPARRCKQRSGDSARTNLGRAKSDAKTHALPASSVAARDGSAAVCGGSAAVRGGPR